VAIADATELKARLAALMGTTWATLLTEEAQDAAIAQAFEELGWVYPILVSRKAYWLIERCRRHALYSILVLQAERFQYKQIKLQHKFDNYFKLISAADVAFAKAMEEEAALMDVGGMDDEMSALFAKGFFMNPAGFIYDQLGRDLTYGYR
jgi:hypothetical protein